MIIKLNACTVFMMPFILTANLKLQYIERAIGSPFRRESILVFYLYFLCMKKLMVSAAAAAVVVDCSFVGVYVPITLLVFFFQLFIEFPPGDRKFWTKIKLISSFFCNFEMKIEDVVRFASYPFSEINQNAISSIF